MLLRLPAGAALLFVLAGTGCNFGPATARPVDPEVARQTLEQVLSDWRDGGTPDAWQQRSPQVVVQDFDWAAGAALTSFEILGPGEARDANLFCRVRLVLNGPAKGGAQRTVTYVVGTDPVLTVFRDVMQ
jgi:hypothetical protein